MAEVSDSEQMYTLLQQRLGIHGRRVWLLVIVDEQDIAGPILHSAHTRLIFWVQPICKGPLALGGDNAGPYEPAIAFACRRILQDPEGLMPGGKVGGGHWPQVTSSAELLPPGNLNFKTKPAEAGLWCGTVQHQNAKEKVLMAAFDGFSEREIAYPGMN